MHRSRVVVWSLLKATARKWSRDNCLRLGASLSYYTLFSLFPLILVVLAITKLLLINSDAARDIILKGLSSVTGGFRDDFVQALDAAAKTRRASGIIGTATLILGSSWVFGELVSAFNIIWDVEPPSQGGPFEFLRSTFFSFALVLAVAFLLLVSMIVNAALTAISAFTATLPGGVIVRTGIQIGVTISLLTLIFALLFKYLPRTHVAWSDVWIGASLTAVIWSLLQYAISYYIALSSYKDYGAIGSILALVAWVYLSSQVLFVGGEFTAVFARQHGSRTQAALRAEPAAVDAPRTP
jgi:membrane protein